MKTDSLFYRLFQTLPQLLFDLIARTEPNATHYHFESVELKQTAFRVDGVFQPPPEQFDWPLFFVEVQFQLDPDLYSRLFAEIFLYLRQQRPVHPWRAVVIYPNRAVDPGDHLHYRALLRSEYVTLVYLDEWSQPRQTLMQRLIGMLLADSPQAVREAQVMVGQLQDVQRVDTVLATTIIDLVETILVYKLPMLSRKEIQTMLELTDTDLKQTRFYQEVFTEGRQEGRQEEGATLILRQLQRRCGVLTLAVQEQVVHLSLPQLEALGEALLDFNGPDDLTQWLATYARE